MLQETHLTDKEKKKKNTDHTNRGYAVSILLDKADYVENCKSRQWRSVHNHKRINSAKDEIITYVANPGPL